MIATYASGMWKTVDGGSNWTAVTTPLVSGATWTTVSSSSDMSVIILAVGAKLYKSVDGGANWTLIYNLWTDNMWTIVQVSGNGSVIAASNRNGSVDPQYSAILSTNGGTTFTYITQPNKIIMPYVHGGANTIGMSNTGSTIVWASAFGPLLYTTNTGTNWYRVSNHKYGQWAGVGMSDSGSVALYGESYQGGMYLSNGGPYNPRYLDASASEQWKHVALSRNGTFAYAINGDGIHAKTL